MAKYKLTYFPFAARGELIRFIFAQAGVEYEDVRIPFEKWQELKPKTPWGRIPILEVDGQTIAGSLGIARFLADRFGLAGANDVENAQMFGLLDYVEDTFISIVDALKERDETKRAEMKKNVQEKVIPEAFRRLEKLAAANNSPDGWLFGTKVSYVDFAVYNFIAIITPKMPTILDNFPNLAKLKASVEGLENIKKWLEERPAQVFPPGLDPDL